MRFKGWHGVLLGVALGYVLAPSISRIPVVNKLPQV